MTDIVEQGEASAPARQRILIFIVAYNAEKTIEQVLTRIPHSLTAHDTEILVIDDASKDRTFEQSEIHRRTADLPFHTTVLCNPVNQGYGGNQKIGFHYAIEHGFDVVALVHGDGQYAPECLPELVAPLLSGEADAVFGSRMLTRGDARRGGMPLYKYVGNRILTGYQNMLLGSDLSEFHSGYRLYSVDALKRIPFHLNTNVFHFDTEIIVQFLLAGMRIRELPIPTYYGDEICHVDGLRYARDVVEATFLGWAQQFGILYRRHFDVRPDDAELYEAKIGFESTHTNAIEAVPPGARVLDVGCAGAHVARALAAKGCRVTGVDIAPVAHAGDLDRFILHDLDAGPIPVDLRAFDVILLLDVIEHVKSPERFVEQLSTGLELAPETRLVVSSGNVAFIIARLMLLIGQFNYGKRGILDLTHTRLFTFPSFRRLFQQAGFQVEEVTGIPAPFPMAIGGRIGRIALRFNRLMIRLWRDAFSYQMFMVVRPLPSLALLLTSARIESDARAEAIEETEAANAD